MSKLFSNIDTYEEWRDIPNWEGMYEVSNKGRIRSVDRVIRASNGNESFKKGQLIAISTNMMHCNVQLYKGNKIYNMGVHRAVALAFIPNPKNLPEVDHIDNNPQNNCVENLRWVSSKENTAHRIANRSSCKAKKVYCIDTGETFDSLSAAGRSVHSSTQQIIDSINHKSCCKGKVFVYADNIPEDLETYAIQAHAKYENFHYAPKMPTSRKVVALETAEIFDSMTDAAYHFNCDIATIRNRIKANKPFNGITLKFISED